MHMLSISVDLVIVFLDLEIDSKSSTSPQVIKKTHLACMIPSHLVFRLCTCYCSSSFLEFGIYQTHLYYHPYHEQHIVFSNGTAYTDFRYVASDYGRSNRSLCKTTDGHEARSIFSSNGQTFTDS